MIQFVPHPDVATRKDFGALLTSLGCTGTAIEIGTHLGEFAEHLLDTWPGKLICVDPWQNQLPGYHDIVAYRDRNADYDAAVARLGRFGERVELWRMLSSEAVSKVPNDSLDFVYIDGNHLPPFLGQDIKIWWPKLRAGGVYAGHDLNNWEWARYVVPAVTAFAKLHRLQPHRTVDDPAVDSWFFIKPEGKKR